MFWCAYDSFRGVTYGPVDEMTDSTDTDTHIDELHDAETVAVVGCSATPGKSAHDVPAYLVEKG